MIAQPADEQPLWVAMLSGPLPGACPRTAVLGEVEPSPLPTVAARRAMLLAAIDWQEAASAVGAESMNGCSRGPAEARHDSSRPHRHRSVPQAPPGAALRSASIIVAPAATLWRIALRILPNEARAFGTLRQVFRGVHDGRVPKEHEGLAMAHVYRDLGRTDLTRDLLLQAGEATQIMCMDDVQR